ncbi:MAG TPA: hypothetical protein VG963_20875, partial [Polyangiaceae bacterium]|nr:hypothetical protein [Polyangiaceae bacterium]
MDPIAAQLIARLQSDPSDRDAYDALKAHYAHSGDLASLANLLEGWAETNASDWQAASEAYAEAADAVLHSSNDRPRAKALYNKALGLNPLQPHAAGALRALLEAGSDFGELAEFLDAYARGLEANGGAVADIAAAYRRLGEIWQDVFELPDVARDYLARAAQLEGGGVPAAEGGAAVDPEAQPTMRPEQASQIAA